MTATVGRPGWHHYLAYVNSVPAATGLAYIDGETAWLGSATTLPEFRGKGCQGAILAQRLQDGIAAGVRLFTVSTVSPGLDGPNSSYRNVERAGFLPSDDTLQVFSPILKA